MQSTRGHNIYLKHFPQVHGQYKVLDTYGVAILSCLFKPNSYDSFQTRRCRVRIPTFLDPEIDDIFGLLAFIKA